jgi:hypothetical protein
MREPGPRDHIPANCTSCLVLAKHNDLSTAFAEYMQLQPATRAAEANYTAAMHAATACPRSQTADTPTCGHLRDCFTQQYNHQLQCFAAAATEPVIHA